MMETKKQAQPEQTPQGGVQVNLLVRCKHLEELLDEAVQLVEAAAEEIMNWGMYASPYFQEKHHLEEDVSHYRVKALILKRHLTN